MSLENVRDENTHEKGDTVDCNCVVCECDEENSENSNDNLREVRVEDLPEEEESECQEPDEFSDDKCNLYSSVKYCKLLKIIAESENEEQFLLKKCNRIDLTALPPKQYLEETVIPILMQALQYLIRERPPEPINALCVYLLKYKSDFEQYCNTEPPEYNPEEEKK